MKKKKDHPAKLPKAVTNNNSKKRKSAEEKKKSADYLNELLNSRDARMQERRDQLNEAEIKELVGKVLPARSFDVPVGEKR